MPLKNFHRILAETPKAIHDLVANWMDEQDTKHNKSHMNHFRIKLRSKATPDYPKACEFVAVDQRNDQEHKLGYYKHLELPHAIKRLLENALEEGADIEALQFILSENNKEPGDH